MVVDMGPVRAFTWAILNSIGASHLVHFRLRTLAWRAAGVDINLRTRVFPGVVVRSSRLHVGRRSTINEGTIIDNRAHVHIGDNVGIGIACRILTGSHLYDDPSVRAGVGTADPVRIEDGAWLGSGVTVLPGVVVERGCVIAAGSVVTRTTEPHGLYAGIPARRVRDLPDNGHVHGAPRDSATN